MELVRDDPAGKVYVRAVDDNGIKIGQDIYQSSLVLSPESVHTDWNPETYSDISEESLEFLLKLEPELVIIGTGKKQHFPDPALLMKFYSAGIGIEFMNTQAACRTFNILVMEERKVVAGLIPVTAD